MADRPRWEIVKRHRCPSCGDSWSIPQPHCPTCMTRLDRPLRNEEKANAVLEDLRCGSNSCVFGPRPGQNTNGKCRCYTWIPAEHMRKVHALAKLVREMIDDD